MQSGERRLVDSAVHQMSARRSVFLKQGDHKRFNGLGQTVQVDDTHQF